MTRIIKIEAKGFKSFANKTELVFGDHFNCIIGPNGSGKSNVIDAICFVLGKGSAKGLRAERSANLIYNGGKLKTPAKQGEVSLFFDNTKKTFPVDEEVVKITRVVKQNGSSIYRINDKAHTRGELLDFLAKANVDPDGYNIILQGDIAHLIEMSGNERRQVIEEMSGIGIYEDKKQKAVRELEKVEQGIQEGTIVLNERASHLKELKKERDQAIRHQELTVQLQQAKKTLVHLQKIAKEKELEDIDRKGKERQEQIAALEEKIKQKKIKVKEEKQRIVSINAEIEQKGEKEQVALLKVIEELKVSIATDTHKVESYEQEIGRVNARIDSLKASLKDIEEKIAAGEGREKELKKSLKDKQALQSELTQKIQVLKKKFNLEGASAIEQRIEAIDKEADELQKQIATQREKQQDDMREKDRLDVQLEHIDEKIAKVKELQSAHKDELEKLQQKKIEFKKATVELSQKLADDNKIGSQLSGLRTRLQKAAEEMSRAEARQAAMMERQGGDIAIKKILENRKQFPGVHGTVSQLGVVDTKYGLALEIAAGNKLNGIVVDDDKTAAACIAYLRDNKYGVATFFPISKIRARKKDKEIDSVAGARGAHGYALDLIDYDPQYKNIMSFVFGNTVIVESLDVARRIGIGTCKMVTLQGDSAETSGAMRGGFQRRAGKGSAFAEKQSQDQMQKIQQEYTNAQSLISALEKDKMENEETIIRLRELKASLEGDIIRMEKSLYINADDAAVSDDLKKEFVAKAKELDGILRKSNDAIMVLTRKLTELKIERQKLRSEVSDIRNPTKLAELNTFEEKHQKMREQIASLTAQIEQTSLHSKQMYLPEIENIQKIIKQHEKEIEQFRKEQQGLSSQVAVKKKELAVSEARQKEFYAKFKTLLEERNRLQTEIEKIDTQIIDLEEKVRDVERQNNVLSIEIARVRTEIAALDEEAKQFASEILLLEDKQVDSIKKMIWSTQQKLEGLGHVNMKALDTYEKIQAEYDTLLAKKQRLEQEKTTISGIMDEIEHRKIEIFQQIFGVLNDNFRKLFVRLSTKGDAYLELENPERPFDGGAFIKVRLNGKKFMDIRSLSGGEKAMTALAFIFAIQEYSPASFYVLDEVDAALDKKNAERLAELVRQYSEKAQFITISHNDGVLSAADQLYGVSMNEHGMSQVVSLKL